MIGTLAAEKYVILGMISEGGMGAVYRALQLPVEREVALKVLRTELQDSDQGRDRFILEARAVSRLNHPNIITLHDFGFDENNHPYMVMEYAPGKSLARWLRDEIDIDRIVHIMEQVLSALSEAHDRGIVHRDLKPENMIVTKAGADYDYVKLLDFGIARMINEGATRKLTREGEVFGTPHYMAPEQAQGKKNVGPPADVYACGIILWELISGNCPFDAPTPLAVLFMHINEDLPKLVPRAGMVVPKEIEAVLERATKKDPLARYQHAGEMLNALKAAVNSAVKRNTLTGSQAVAAAARKKARTPEPAPKKRASSSSGIDPAKPLSLASRAEAADSSMDLPIYDPEPTNERAAPRQPTSPGVSPKTTNPPEEDQAKLKLSLAALGILVGFAVLVVGGVFILGGNDTPESAEAAEVETVETTENAPTETTASAKPKKGPEVAAKDTTKKVEPSNETAPVAKTTESIPTSVKDPVDPKTVAGHLPPNMAKTTVETTPKEEPVEVAPKKDPEPVKVEPKKTTTKTTTTKTTTKKTEPKKSTTASDTKTTDTKDEPKKFEPKTFEAPPPTKWK